jgi:hypothetical protein
LPLTSQPNLAKRVGNPSKFPCGLNPIQ